MRNPIFTLLMSFSAVFVFNADLRADTSEGFQRDPEYPWIRHGTVFYERLDSTGLPVYFYRDSREARYLLSGSLVGLEFILQNELRNSPPPEELPNLLFSLFRSPNSAMIRESLLVDYEKALREMGQIEADYKLLNPGAPARTSSASERMARALPGLRNYIEKTGCFASEAGWIVEYYSLRRGGELISSRFEFKHDWSLVSLEIRRIASIPALDHSLLDVGL